MKRLALLIPLMASPAYALDWQRPAGRVGFELSTQGETSSFWRSLATQNALSVSLGQDVYFDDCWGVYFSGRLKGVVQESRREAWGILGAELSGFEALGAWSFFLGGNLGGPLPSPVFESLQLSAEHPLLGGVCSLTWGGFLTQAHETYPGSQGTWLEGGLRRKFGPLSLRLGTSGEVSQATSLLQAWMTTCGAQLPIGLGFSLWMDSEYRLELAQGIFYDSVTLSAGSAWRF